MLKPSTIDRRADGPILLARLRGRLLRNNDASMMASIAKSFAEVDEDHSGTLSLDEFFMATAKLNFPASANEVRALFEELDNDGDGQLPYREFMVALRGGDMSVRRQLMVDQAFAMVDASGTGEPTLNDLMGRFAAEDRREVKAGAKTALEVTREVREQMEPPGRQGDQPVSQADWTTFHANISAFTRDDFEFERSLRADWRLTAPFVDLPPRGNPERLSVNDQFRPYRGFAASRTTFGGFFAEDWNTVLGRAAGLEHADQRARGRAESKINNDRAAFDADVEELLASLPPAPPVKHNGPVSAAAATHWQRAQEARGSQRLGMSTRRERTAPAPPPAPGASSGNVAPRRSYKAIRDDRASNIAKSRERYSRGVDLDLGLAFT